MQEGLISINTQAPEELAALVKEVDPNLNYIRDLHPRGSSCRTLLVDQAGTEQILKIRAISNNVWDDTYFFYEIHALRRAGERKLANVTYLVDEYNTDRFHAILKTYVEGTPLNSLDYEMLLRDEGFIKKLDALYLQLHLAGIAKINFQPRKFVICADNELTLVDLSTCVVNTEAGISLFSQEMRADSRYINKLEKTARAG